jgi:UDPglucose--hexose-1-phosphate uridylyltransferase
MAAAHPPAHDPHEPRIHHEPLAGRSVIVAPGRAARPDDASLGAETGDPRSWCPFCSGNESRTPPAHLRVPGDESLPWRARIVPNRFPIAVDTCCAPEGGAGDRPAHGVHDVVIESAAHERSVLAVESGAWRDVWELVRRRLADLAGRGDLAWASVFKNSGPLAGASLEHLHSQLVGLDLVPAALATELAAAATHADPFGDLLAAAARDERIVHEQGDLVALVPHAPRQPLETWILPRSPEAFFHATAPERVAALADLTYWFVGRLAALAPAADYNWWLHQLPFSGHAAVAGRWHWHLEILPRITPLAGFELATGCHISVMTPREAARRLRGE